MKIIAVMSPKGGIGKTTSADSIAYILGEEFKKRVLIIEGDQQGDTSETYGCYEPEGIGMSELIEKHVNVGGNFRTTDTIKATRYQHIDIIPANGYLMQTDMNLLMKSDENQIFRLRDALGEIADAYDYCICDCGRLFDMVVINILMAAGLVIVPVKVGGYEVRAIMSMAEQIEELKQINPELRIKMLLTMRQKNKTSLEFEEWLKSSSGFEMFAAIVRRSVIAERAAIEARPLPEFSPKCIASKDYREVALEIMEELEGKGGIRMATGYTVLNALNRQTKAGIDDTTPRAKFRTKDLSIFKIYANEDNFYVQEDIEQKAGEILAIGLLENLVVKYEPLETVGEYKLISGERRWRALRLLVERGYKEFEFVTCNVVAPATSHEEKVALIIANSHRNKDLATILRETRELKETLEDMKSKGIELKGYNLQSGRLRDVLAELLNISKTKAAQIDAINNNLIPEFMDELDKNRLTFSAVYELAGMSQDEQKRLLAVLEDTGELTYQTIKAMKGKTVSESDTATKNDDDDSSEMSAGSNETDGNINQPQMAAVSERNGEENDDAAENPQMAAGSEYEEPHPEGIISLCYSCKNYFTCNVKTGTCSKCDQYINKAESEKTEEQRYSEEQDRIDRETARKLRQQTDERKMEKLPSESQNGGHRIHQIKIGTTFFGDVCSGKKTFELRKNDRNYREGDILELMEYADGVYTGQSVRMTVTYVLEDYTGLTDGYCIMAIKKEK